MDGGLPFAGVGRRLFRIRQSLSALSQKDWAAVNGFEPTRYNNWERGARRIPVDPALALCTAYGLTLDYIYFGRIDALSIITARRMGLVGDVLASDVLASGAAPVGVMVGDDGLEPPTFSV